MSGLAAGGRVVRREVSPIDPTDGDSIHLHRSLSRTFKAATSRDAVAVVQRERPCFDRRGRRQHRRIVNAARGVANFERAHPGGSGAISATAPSPRMTKSGSRRRCLPTAAPTRRRQARLRPAGRTARPHPDLRDDATGCTGPAGQPAPGRTTNDEACSTPSPRSSLKRPASADPRSYSQTSRPPLRLCSPSASSKSTTTARRGSSHSKITDSDAYSTLSGDAMS
jgi:hypothetical protein